MWSISLLSYLQILVGEKALTDDAGRKGFLRDNRFKESDKLTERDFYPMNGKNKIGRKVGLIDAVVN
jgi:hypothetical protein